jgi:hypothetical protein
MNSIIPLVLATVISQAATASPVETQQRLQVRKFYRFVIGMKTDGIPSKGNIQKLSPLISAKFQERLLKALAAEDRHSKEAAEPEPPLVEGSLFFSLFEGADRIGAISREKTDLQTTYLVELEYGDPKNPKQFVKWKDRAILIQENGKWVMDDLELLGNWEFGFKGKLSDLLEDTAKY